MPELDQNNNVFYNSNIVIALLDWGLGHTTRIIPILRYLIEKKCNITIACTPEQKALLISEFAQVHYTPLEGYDIHYSKNSALTRISLGLQVRKILIKINRENKWLHGYLQQHRCDLVISDNRYGFFSTRCPSIFITHQLQIKTGLGKWLDRLVNYLNHRKIQQFSACWVPDFPETPSLAGELSHPSSSLPFPVKYIGPLSRLLPCSPAADQSRFVLVILSGPEPQRTIFEKMILQQAALLSEQFIVIRGLPDAANLPGCSSNVRLFNHLPSPTLNEYLCRASCVISRSGYTSIMDYCKLSVRAVLVPTPGQAEQEYLAGLARQQQWAIVCHQQDFQLARVIEASLALTPQWPHGDMDQYKKVVADALSTAV